MNNPTTNPEGFGNKVSKAVAFFFILVFFLLIWPVYPFFATIQPFVFGMPFALFYIVFILVVTFLILLFLFLWEERSGRGE